MFGGYFARIYFVHQNMQDPSRSELMIAKHRERFRGPVSADQARLVAHMHARWDSRSGVVWRWVAPRYA